VYKEMFQMVLQKGEEIKWCNRANAKASMLKGLVPAIALGAFFSIWICGFLTPIINFGNRNFTPTNMFAPALFIFPIIIACYIIYAILNAKNTYFCITNKRIIKRSGAFNNNFIHYTLKNVGTIQVVGGIVDSNGSATLLITTKDFHTDNKGNANANRLRINSLYDAYEAYNILSELVDGNNETLRVKLEK